MKKTEKYKVLAVIRRMLLHMWKQDKAQFARIACYTAVASIYPFIAVFLPKLAVGILEQGGNDAGKKLVIAMLLYLMAAGTLALVMNYLKSYIETRNMRIRLLYVGEQAKKIQRMDYSYHEDAGFFEKYEKAMQAGSNNANGIEGVYNRLAILPAKLFTLLGMTVLAGALSPLLLLSLIGHVAVMLFCSKLSHDYEYSQKEKVSKAGRRISYYQKTSQDFSYGKDIRIFDLRKRIMDNYQAEIDAYLKLQRRIRNREYLFGFLGIVTLLITNILIYGTLIERALDGMPVSSFTMYVTMTASLMTLMLDFGKDLSFLWNEGEYVNDFYRMLDAPLVAEGEKTMADVMAGAKKDSLEVVFEHVTFRYPGTEKTIFKDLNFTIHEGERLAIVGVNGAGKSTLVKLMTGLFLPTEGHIYINGVDITELKKEELYKLYSAVFQDVNILAFSLRENVACKAEDVNDTRVRCALEKVGLWEKVKGFEKGLDQMMLKVIDENGTDFSGGERQKLSIARGLYKDAPMVIMDEPTAALDALAEAEIYEKFSALVEGKTAVYISHRLASTRFCDKIALFDAEGLAEYGSHEELMACKGKYYEMFAIQGKYYQEATA